MEIWKLADELSVRIHEMTIKDLPKFEMFEVGSQIRRSIKSVRANIVEGYGRRAYKQEFIHFLTIAKGSVDESTDHLDTLFITKSLKNQDQYNDLKDKLDKLSRMLYLFILTVKKQHNQDIH